MKRDGTELRKKNERTKPQPQGCRSDETNPTSFLTEGSLQSDLKVAIQYSSNLLSALRSSPPPDVASILGVSDPESVTAAEELLELTLLQLQKTSEAVGFASEHIEGWGRCAGPYLPYRLATDGGMCTDLAFALTWCFGCLAAVAVGGMAVVTLRASWRDVLDFVEPGDRLDKNYSGGRGERMGMFDSEGAWSVEEEEEEEEDYYRDDEEEGRGGEQQQQQQVQTHQHNRQHHHQGGFRHRQEILTTINGSAPLQHMPPISPPPFREDFERGHSLVSEPGMPDL